MNLAEIGNRIKICRKQQKITQENLAEKIDVSSHYIYEIERGNKTMSLPVLEKISTTLNISTDYILFGDRLPDSPRKDRLLLITEQLSPRERENIAEILSAIIPYLK